MNSLELVSVCAKKIVVSLMIISLLTISAAAQQRVAPQEQGKMYGDPGFRGEVINLNVVNADIREILSYITEQYGINFVIDKSVKAIPVTVNVSDVPWNVALDAILRSQDLGVQVNGPILRIAEQKTLADESAIAQRIRESQLDTSPLYTEFIRLNYARASGTLPQGSPTSGTSGSGLGESGGSAGQNSGGEGLLPIIKRRLSRRGAIEVDGRSNSLIITDVRENIDAIRQLVSLLDQPEPQIEIEARIVVATRSFSRDVGVQLSALLLGSRGSGGSLETIPGTEISKDAGDIVGRGFRNNGIPSGIGTPPNGGLGADPTIANSVLGLTTGIFGTAQISLLLTAGEQKGEAKTIATPKVSTLNNRKAKVESKLQIPVFNAQPTGGGAIATTQYIDIPISLEITPQITDSGNVILRMVVENSSLAGGGTISSQNVETELMVPDGGTTVVGGVLSDDERENQDRTPGLSSIPFLGNLFKRKGVSRNTNELLFFITPRIIRPELSGNPNPVNSGMRTTTIIQPVPLGNPPSNSGSPTNSLPAERNPLLPVVPVTPTEVLPGTPIKN